MIGATRNFIKIAPHLLSHTMQSGMTKGFIVFQILALSSGGAYGQTEPVVIKELKFDPRIKNTIELIRGDLIDPDSAIFRAVCVREGKDEKGEIEITVVGEVNAKNRFGGYTGFTLFVDTGKERGVIPVGIAPANGEAECENPYSEGARR